MSNSIIGIDFFLDGPSESSNETISVCKKLDYSDCIQPIYEVPPNKYSAERILKILLDPKISASVICTVRPADITKSATYVVNIHKLEHPDDIKNDNFRKWEHSGSHPLYFRVQVEPGDHLYVEKCAAGATGDNVVLLRRLHSVHPSNNKFKRMIAFVSGKYIFL